LLIHLGAWRHSINGQVQYFGRLDHFVQAVDVHENLFEHERLVQIDEFTFCVSVCTRMDDSIHVEVKVVDFDIFAETFFQSIVDNIGVLVREPTKHFGDTKEG
jgi:hypothetical protein